MQDAARPRDLLQITLGVLSIVALAAASFWVMKPFLAATVWAGMIVIATWPMLIALEKRFGGRRAPAVVVMVLVLLAAFVAPIWAGVSAIADNLGVVKDLAHTLVERGLPPPPEWVERIPMIGRRIDEVWRDAAGNPGSLAARASPHVGAAVRWVMEQLGGLGSAILQFGLTVIISGMLYTWGEGAGMGVRRFLRRLGGANGENAAILAAQAIRAVALGIVVTAVMQSVLAGAGLFIGGIPSPGILTAVVFVLCIAQLGPLLVMVPAAIWLFSHGATGRGIVVVVAALLAVTLDNVVRPVLIKRGADISLVLILAGVMGGVLAFGVVGLFVGPVILAVSWTLLSSWVTQGEGPRDDAPAAPGPDAA